MKSMEIEQWLSKVRTVRKIYEMHLPLNLKEEKLLNDRYIQEEVFASNHIEGNSYTLSETRFLLETGRTCNGKKLKDSIEIKNLQLAIFKIKEYVAKEIPLSEDMIKELHLITTHGTLDDVYDEGQYKKVRNWIGEVTTASPKDTPARMRKLIYWYNKEGDTRHVIEKATEFVYKFICIHPFIDGNGRVARLLFNYILLKNDYILMSILPEHKEAYYKVLAECDKTNYKPLVPFLCERLVESYQRRIVDLGGE